MNALQYIIMLSNTHWSIYTYALIVNSMKAQTLLHKRYGHKHLKT